MIGFHEVFTKWEYNIFENFFRSNKYSQDPWVNYNLSTSILFEGNYITAFGLVTLNQATGTFRMSKPLAFVSGGLKNLLVYLKKWANKYFGKTLLWFGFGFLMTTIFCISVQIMMEKYQTI